MTFAEAVALPVNVKINVDLRRTAIGDAALSKHL